MLELLLKSGETIGATLLLLLVLCGVAFCGVDAGVRGVVVNRQGDAVAGADVVITLAGKQLRTTTAADGTFAFASPGNGTAEIRATLGLSSAEALVNLRDAAALQLVISVTARQETVSVTATRFPVPQETTPAVRELGTRAIEDDAALSLDGVLRQIPSFTLFRRTPGWSANPTAQGVSLRGLGASGASRALVLADGVPMNDPFGGWVYWNRVPRAEIETIETAVGPESDLYGTDALGGAIQLLRHPTGERYLVFDTSYSSLVTGNGSAAGGFRAGDWMFEAAGEGFRTNGYVPVLPADRGAVDTVVNSKFAGGEGTVERSIGKNGLFFVRGNYYGEARQNGTYLQTNNADIREFTAGSEWATGADGRLGVRAYGGYEKLGQSFSAISADRNTETLTRLQSVPAQQFGASIQWAGLFHGQNVFLGADGRHIAGESDEIAYAQGIPSAALSNGGNQNVAGVTGLAYLHPHSRVLVSIGARVDHWTNANGASSTTTFSAGGLPAVTQFADRSETAFSPKLGLQISLTDNLRFFSSAARAFRAPTLNELYRGFRVGNVLTLANPDLHAERLTGVETGLRMRIRSRATLQGSWYWNQINDPVANVTEALTPTLITRQRQNLGQTRSRGVDTFFEWAATNSITFRGGYLYSNATVTEFPASPLLVGAWVPQVPHHTATAQARFASARFGTVALQGRYQGRQFDDDQNLFPLAGFFTLDAFASHELRSGVEVYVGAENLLGRRYEVGRTPVLTVGPPAMARVGIRWTLGETASH